MPPGLAWKNSSVTDIIQFSLAVGNNGYGVPASFLAKSSLIASNGKGAVT